MSDFSQNPFVVSSGTEPKPEMQRFLEGAAQSFVAGDLVFYNSTSKLVVCGADPALILGIAQQNATGVEDTLIQVQILKHNYVVSMAVASDTGVIGDSGDVTNLTAYGVEKIDNVWYVSVADTANDRVVVHKPIVDVLGNNDPRVKASFIIDNLQWHKGF